MLYRPSRTPPVNLDTEDERKKERNEAAARIVPHSEVGGWKTQAYYATLLFAVKQKVRKNNWGGGDSATKKKKKKSRSKKPSQKKKTEATLHTTRRNKKPTRNATAEGETQS